MNLSVSLNLDGEFLRRKCVACSREFKWSQNTADALPDCTEYHCPYCGAIGAAAVSEWLTDAQLDYAKQHALAAVVGPELKKLEAMTNRVSGMLRLSIKNAPTPPVAPEEPNDMTRIDSSCHPDAPVKVLEDWSGDVHCLVCGVAAPPPR